MGKKAYYNVYEDDRLIMENVTKKEITERLPCSLRSLEHYLGSRKKMDGKYSFEIYEKEAKPVFEEKWDEAVAPFKRVKWSKTEGRKLSVY